MDILLVTRTWARRILLTWWAPIVVYLLLLVSCYLLIWQFIEPIDVEPAKLALILRYRISWHVLASLLIASHITIFLVAVAHRIIRGPAPITPGELKRFHATLEPLLRALSAQSAGRTVAETQDIVRTGVASACQLHFGIDVLPIISVPEIPPFPSSSVSCSVCKGQDVGITSSGQCPRCRLFCSGWINLRQVQ